MGANLKYEYELLSTKDSSSKYGQCEICKQFASEVFHQIESLNGSFYKCFDYFGHKECLIKKRRN